MLLFTCRNLNIIIIVSGTLLFLYLGYLEILIAFFGELFFALSITKAD